MSAPASRRLPLLAIPYAGLSLPVMTSAQAAAGLCSILWLVDGDDPIQADRRALERFGQVVDLGRTSAGRWADVVGPLRPDGILTFSDQRMVELAHLAEDLGLSFHRPEVARRLTDKVAQRDALRRAGLPVPATTALGSELDDGDLKEIAKGVRFPAVLKPVYGTDSRTTVRVDDPDELLGALDRCLTVTGPTWCWRSISPTPLPALARISPTTCRSRAWSATEPSSTSP